MLGTFGSAASIAVASLVVTKLIMSTDSVSPLHLVVLGACLVVLVAAIVGGVALAKSHPMVKLSVMNNANTMDTDGRPLPTNES